MSSPSSWEKAFKGRLFGAHTSTAGGFVRAVERAVACRFTAAQIFVKNNKQWMAPPIAAEDAKAFKDAQQKAGLFVCGHSGYLINLGSGADEMIEKSTASLTAELERAELLGLPFVVHHPGSPGKDGEEAGLERITARMKEILKATKKAKVRVALECTAGQGGHLGWRLEHLRELLSRIDVPDRLGVCLDTAHLFAAGYDLRTRADYDKTMKEIETVIGTERVLCFHLNDSKVPFNSRKDRHDNLGEGEIGLDAFKWLVADPRWKKTPMVLETPKEEEMAEDVANWEKLVPFVK
ncbi:Endonuclease IV [Verrucomicrobium sp. GAS474]|uniref:deoxyribonuclease IV n=1 Tax=Verrucomicrobium sp. GAS474 TaxID=1882831 RepID=UPI00087D11BA|nr:deoxyribonuclease IV [Verrucomicrobium sp. GAS474]SDU09872.1 Endonuclease IV [Verrucomicrobium sp. GAS474]